MSYTQDAARLARIRCEIPIWNVNSVAEFFLELLLKYRPELTRALEQTRLDREGFLAELSAVPLIQQVWPSGGNFLLARVHGDPAALCRHLLAHENIYVKDVSARFGGRPFVRLAVCPAADRRRLLGALQRLLREAPAS
ncbi:MAG: hypothetical protein ACYCW6_11515 [Candidatus Xenobia bacterium]